MDAEALRAIADGVRAEPRHAAEAEAERRRAAGQAAGVDG